MKHSLIFKYLQRALLYFLVLKLNIIYCFGTIDGNVNLCGKRPTLHLPLIAGGTDSTEGEWPWHSALYILNRNDITYDYYCGGTLISSSLVLTAAHCTIFSHIPIPADRLSIKLGVTSLKSFESGLDGYKVRKIIRHSKYDPIFFQYDIALLKTTQTVRFTDSIQPVCMPLTTSIESIKFGTVLGWRASSEELSESVLQQTTLEQVDNLTCLSYDVLMFSALLPEDSSKFCAGNIKKTYICDGDNGGGLFVYSEALQRWFIKGIVSAGVKTDPYWKNGCNTIRYTTFSNVTFFADWIDSAMNETTTNLLDLSDCAVDDHDLSVPENEKPIFLQYTWVTILEHIGSNGTKLDPVCSGVLIHPRFVLAIGHCACDWCDDIKLTSVLLGDYDLTKDPDTDIHGVGARSHSIPVARVIRHPLFDTQRYMLALIMLAESAPSNNANIKPVCLPNFINVIDHFTIVGWKSARNDVQQREIHRLLNKNVCKKLYSSINIDLGRMQSFVCVNRYDRRTNNCYSFRSGSSLHYLDTVDGINRYFLRGIFAFGSSRCNSKLPDVFVDVTYYLEWIKETINDSL